jgi:hypothetical protein
MINQTAMLPNFIAHSPAAAFIIVPKKEYRMPKIIVSLDCCSPTSHGLNCNAKL